MLNELPENFVLDFPPRDRFGLRVSIIHEDNRAGLNARHSLDRLARSLGLERDYFDVRPWSFGLLSRPTLRTLAAREARNFEIILLSANSCAELPPAVKEWMSEWMNYRQAKPCALAVLLNDSEYELNAESPLARYLTGIADQGGLDLVYPFRASVVIPPEFESIREKARRAINASAVLDGILDDWESVPPWGFDE